MRALAAPRSYLKTITIGPSAFVPGAISRWQDPLGSLLLLAKSSVVPGEAFPKLSLLLCVRMEPRGNM